ncbi:MAG TPA: Rrf2 family transcriptional regulator [Nitrospirota bacterium]|nr:Rrf2 family transcriptional regulator [Nitrospirota bacterium]
MLVTRETDYAVRTVLYLAKNRDRTASVTEVAHAMQIPKSFLAKLLQRLVRSHILTSLRGVNGGFQLAQKPSEITLLSIIEAVQGTAEINVCAIDSKKCKLSSTCAVHPVWVEIRKEVEKRLTRETIGKLIGR